MRSAQLKAANRPSAGRRTGLAPVRGDTAAPDRYARHRLQEAGSLEEWVLRGGGLRFTQLLDALAEAITIRTPSNEIVFANQAALALVGVESLDQLRELTDQSQLGTYEISDERGNPVTLDDLPSAKIAQRGPVEPLLIRGVKRDTGERHWWRLKSSPMEDVDGELIGVFTVIEDLTALKGAESRTRVLAESGRTLASSLDYEQTLRNVSGVVVPELADWCAIDLIDDVARERLVVAPAGEESEAFARSFSWFRSDTVDPDMELGEVLGSGTSRFIEKVTDDDLARWSTSAEALRRLQEFDICSLLIVPMPVPSRTIGAMVFATNAPRGRFDRDDLGVAEQLGRRAAVAVDNAKLHARLADVAETLERSLLPEELPDIPGWDVASLYIPVSSELRMDVGGDFFELFTVGERPFVIIGDIEGKGVAAATLTALMRYGASFAARSKPEPESILAQLDEGLRHHVREATCTALCAGLESDRLLLSSAGHPPALLVSPTGGVREVPDPGPLLGAFEDASWEQHEVPIAPGELVLLYTDGVTDTLGRGRLGRGRLRALLAEHAGRGPQSLLEQLERALRENASGGRWDDLAALALFRHR
jgi:serine phosphatase RsbU (regulator of sigma subunit)/PAS domain-containing protein